MSNFHETAQLWLSTPLPAGSSSDDLDEVHADLALIDTWVAGSVLPMLQSGRWPPATPDVVAALDELSTEIERLRTQDGDENGLANQYLAYACFLRRVYGIFLARTDDGMNE